MSIRVLLFLTLVGLLSIVGCGESDQPTASDTRAEEQAVEQAQGGEVSQVAGTRSRVEVAAAQPEQAISNPVQQRPDPTESESESTPALADRQQSVQSEPEQQSEPTEVQEEAEAPPTNLTDVPATVIKDADLRVRPGLPWPVIERLSAGDEVVILNVATGWYRISYGDEREGWIRRTALDLGVVEPHRILHRPAPAIVAEWQGEQYGVMGQSADGAEVRLLPIDDELAEIVSAPIDEVTLLASDISVQDLPILIGDETVVFPGDDFSVGQGKILPKANEWMWLPWGWLLAHNDTHIWQWRPETDELEFAKRPPGPAKFSPSGEHLAILTSPSDYQGFVAFQDVIVLPLDGAPVISLRRQFHHSIAMGELNSALADYTLLAFSANELNRSLDGDVIAVRLHPQTRETYVYPALLMDTSGKVTIHQGLPEGIPLGFDCYLGSLGGRTDILDWWWLRDDNTFVIYGLCATDQDGPRNEFDIVFSLGGEFLSVEPFSRRDDDEAVSDLVRSARGGELLGEWLSIDWSPTGLYALVIDRDQSLLRSYDALAHQLREFWLDSRGTQSSSVQQVRLDHILGNLGHVPHWEIYWFDGKTAAAIPWRDESYAPAGHILYLADGSGTALELSSSEYWPCQRTGGWRPDGQQFQLTVGRRWFQLMTFDSGGKLGNVLGLLGDSYWGGAPPHRADWSPNSKWFAVGGQHQASLCIYGS